MGGKSNIMKLSKKVVTLLIAAQLFVLALTSCASDSAVNSGSQQTDSQQKNTELSETIAEENDKSPLESMEDIDFGGEEFTILCRDNKVYEIWSDGENGETVNDAIYRRNLAIEDKYNVNLEYRALPGHWDNQEEFKGAVRDSVAAGDGAYDLIAGYMAYTAELAIEGNFLNLYDINSLDLTNYWWAKGFIDNNTINNCIYFAAGDVSLTMWENIYAFFFNKQLAENYNVGNLYEMVDNKKWTYDALESIVKNISSDLDGNGKYDENDLYGWIANDHSIRALVTAFDIPIAQRNNENTYDFTLFTDKFISVYDRVFEFVNKSDSVYQTIYSSGYTVESKMFMENKALFMSGTLDNTTTLREMENDFGIIPFPMYNENQENYISHSYDGLSVFTVPVSAKNPEMSGTILEAMCAENNYSVIPAFYDTVLMNKVTRDEESAKMLDLLRETLYFDFGYVNGVPAGGIFQLFGDQMVVSKNENITSYIESQRKSIETKFNEVIEAYSNIS